jgi:hypothetical protein
VPFFYRSGEEIKPGDHVSLHGEPGEIEFIADPANDPEDWYVTEYGGGIMIREPKVFGSLFINANGIGNYEDLDFVSRSGAGP